MNRLPSPPSKFRLFVRRALTRNNIAHVAFIGGVVVAGLGLERVGVSFDINGVGLFISGLGLGLYAYLLGKE